MSLNTETSVQLVSLNNPALETTIANICDVRAKKDYRLAGTFVRGTELWLVFQRGVSRREWTPRVECTGAGGLCIRRFAPPCCYFTEGSRAFGPSGYSQRRLGRSLGT